MALWLCLVKGAYLLGTDTPVFVGEITCPLIFALKVLIVKKSQRQMKPDGQDVDYC